MQRLQGIIKNYPWGSTTLLPSLRSEPPAADPEAEIWYGAHPAGPSTFDDGTTLLAQLETDAESLTGADCVARFGRGLPFLLKLLAANRPLSIQVHPSIAQAVEGFTAEEAAGVPHDAPHRSFGDQNHKPELIAALTPFEALVGFRPIDRTVVLLTALGAAPEFIHTLATDGYLAAVAYLLDPRDDDGRTKANTAIRSIIDGANVYDEDDWADEADLLTRLSIIYPGDAGIGVAALLNRILLQPGEAIFLDAGNMHAYVGGLGVEIMANSNNVVRGGLTTKHIDVPALLRIVRPEAIDPIPVAIDNDVYESAAPEFTLTRLGPDKLYDVAGPAIVVVPLVATTVVAGSEAITLRPMEAMWIPVRETTTITTTEIGFLAQVGDY